MTLAPAHATWVIALSFFAAFGLSTVPLPVWAAPFRPEWVTLVLIYWTLALPERIGVGVGWLLGLILDVIKGTLLGQHSLALAVVAFLTLQLYRRIRLFPLGQQALTILVLVAVHQLLTLWINGIIGRAAQSWAYWLPTLTSALIWPWVFLVLRDMRRRFRVS